MSNHRIKRRLRLLCRRDCLSAQFSRHRHRQPSIPFPQILQVRLHVACYIIALLSQTLLRGRTENWINFSVSPFPSTLCSDAWIHKASIFGWLCQGETFSPSSSIDLAPPRRHEKRKKREKLHYRSFRSFFGTFFVKREMMRGEAEREKGKSLLGIFLGPPDRLWAMFCSLLFSCQFPNRAEYGRFD